MATQESDIHEGSLPDLDTKLEEEHDNYGSAENYESDMGVVSYQDDQDNSIILSSLVVEGGSQELLQAQADGYIAADIEDQGQHFLRIAQESGQISINDGDNIVYTDDFMNPIEEQYQKSDNVTVEDAEMYYQADAEELNAKYLTEGTSLEETAAATAVLKQDSSAMLEEIEGDSLPVTSAFLNKSELKNFVTILPEQRGIKRAVPSTSKNLVSKVFVQNSSNGPIIQKSPQNIGNLTGKRITLAQAQRLGLIGPNKIQTAGNQNRVYLKTIKTGSKILPAPTPRTRIVSAISAPVRSTIPMSQVKTILTSTTAPSSPVTLSRTFGGLTVAKLDNTTKKLSLRSGPAPPGSQVRVTGNQHVKYLKLITGNSPQKSPMMRPVSSTPIVVRTDGAQKRIILSGDSDNLSTSTFQIRKQKPMDSLRLSSSADDNTLLLEGDASGIDPEPLDDIDKENEEDQESPVSPQRLLEANGVRPKKPCNCTRSQCLKLYCECFANGEFCYQCNCNNCFNNIEHEEERQLSIKSCLERNPAAFRPRIQVADSDDEERRHNKGCNCKRSYCLKNYCECFEGKMPCGKYCKCTSCRNTEGMAYMTTGENTIDSADEEKELSEKGAPFMPQPLAEALCQCILVQAEAAERKGEDVVTTEQRIIEELGQRLVQIIGNRSKRDGR